MYQLVSRKIKEVTPDVAAKILEANVFEGQRPLRDKHVKILSETILKNLFTVGHIAVAKQCWNGGDSMLANGQHTCHAVIAAGKSITAVCDEYHCKTPEDFALLYRQFDNNAARSLSEIALPEAIALNINWSKQIINAILAGIGYIEHHNGVHKNKRIESLKKYVSEGNAINDLLSCVKATESRHLRRGAVVAAMISTFKKCSADAEIFWEEVRDGDNLKSISPSLKLRNYLLSTNCSVGRGVHSPSLNQAATYKEMFSKCIIAWNAYRRGDATSLKYYAEKEVPKVI